MDGLDFTSTMIESLEWATPYGGKLNRRDCDISITKGKKRIYVAFKGNAADYFADKRVSFAEFNKETIFIKFDDYGYKVSKRNCTKNNQQAVISFNSEMWPFFNNYLGNFYLEKINNPKDVFYLGDKVFSENSTSNACVKEMLKTHNVKQWELANALDIREENLSRKLRHELSSEEQKEMIFMIKKIAKEKTWQY